MAALACAIAIVCVCAGRAAAASSPPTPSTLEGTLSDLSVDMAYTDPDGDQFEEWSQQFDLANVVFTSSGGAKYTLQSGSATLLNEPSEVEHVHSGPTCTTTYAVDKSKSMTGSLTLTATGATLSVEVPETYSTDCTHSSGSGAGAGLAFFMSPLKLHNGYLYELQEGITTVDSPAPNAYAAANSQSEMGELYANGDWGREKRDIKANAQQRARQRLGQAMGLCDEWSDVTGFVPHFFHTGAQCKAGARATYDEALKQIDPADTDFGAVALPQTSTMPPLPRCVGLPRKDRRLCKAIAGASQRYAAALARSGAVEAAIDTTLNRGNTAAAANDSAGEELQNAALSVYGLEEQTADKALDAAGKALARALRAGRLDVVLSAKKADATARKLIAGNLPASVLGALAAQGISRAQLAGTLKMALGDYAPGRLRLTNVLATPITSSDLPPEDLAISPTDFAALVQGLQRAGALDGAQAQTLVNDVQAYESIEPGSSQGGALAALRSATSAFTGEVGTFLTAAAAELE